MENEYKNPASFPYTSIGNWIITLIITMIPILNIIMLFVWGFSRNANPTKANWAKAALILIAAWIILGILFGGYFIRWFYQGYPVAYQ